MAGFCQQEAQKVWMSHEQRAAAAAHKADELVCSSTGDVLPQIWPLHDIHEIGSVLLTAFSMVHRTSGGQRVHSEGLHF